MKNRINQSTWLHKELQDGGLRQLIEQIDAASGDEEDGDDRNNRTQHQKSNNAAISARNLSLARAKHSHPKFASFIDQMLLTSGVLQPADGIDGASIENILEGRVPLVLAPVPRHSDAMDANNAQSESNSGSGDGSSDEESDDSESSEDSEGRISS